MAGNIIPAIATTNAVIAGLIVMQAIQLLAHPDQTPKKAFLGQYAPRPLGAYPHLPPSKSCAVCRDAYITFKVDPTKCTLGEFVKEVAGQWLKSGLEDEAEEFEFSVLEGGRILADPDDEDNHPRTLADLGVDQGKILTVMDEEEKYRPIHFCLCAP
jgi:ubiquitin-like 1-activating enzyme E1 B